MRPIATVVCLIAAFVLLSASAHAQDGLVNPSFEQGEPGAVPEGWFAPMHAPHRSGYRVEIVEEGARDGDRCVRLSYDAARITEKGGGMAFANLMQQVPAEAYRGKRVEYAAWVRTAGGCRGQMWMRVDLGGERMGFFDNMGDRPITDGQWKRYTIVGDVASDAVVLNVGMMMFGQGEAWIDGASLRVVGEAARVLPPQPPALLEGRGLENVSAFVRLAGYVRFFHPSDQAAATDWDRFLIAGVRAVEDAPDASALAVRLGALFRPIAPTVVVTVAGDAEPAAPAIRPEGSEPAGTVAWRHTGVSVGARSGPGIYSSVRVTGTAENPQGIPAPGTVIDRWLPGGVRCVVPVTLYTDARGRTIPVVPPGDEPETPSPSPEDRSTRLAAVATAWTVLRHFYPYWDVVETDWDAELEPALAAAAADADAGEFLVTLRQLIAKLDDGHGFVSGPGENRMYVLPLRLEWVGEELVVAKVIEEGAEVRAGDVMVAIGGREVGELREEVEGLISGSPQWKAARSRSEIARFASADGVRLRLRRPGAAGEEYETTLEPRRMIDPAAFEEARPASGEEVAAGVYYFNLVGATYEELRPRLGKFASAKGVVFDMRGYPDSAGKALLHHLSDVDFVSAHWNRRVTLLPDNDPAGISWLTGHWECRPETPRIRAKVAFITDGSAISYAESCMGIVEHYKIGEIVGEPTAGANGNVNVVQLPGGYAVAYTGMQVLKHDGSQHHIVGVRPTVPCSRTVAGIAAGRDELLERAIKVVSE